MGVVGRSAAQGGVRLSVEHEGETILVYGFATLREAAERCAFLREFLPAARFVLEPLPN